MIHDWILVFWNENEIESIGMNRIESNQSINLIESCFFTMIVNGYYFVNCDVVVSKNRELSIIHIAFDFFEDPCSTLDRKSSLTTIRRLQVKKTVTSLWDLLSHCIALHQKEDWLCIQTTTVIKFHNPANKTKQNAIPFVDNIYR